MFGIRTEDAASCVGANHSWKLKPLLLDIQLLEELQLLLAHGTNDRRKTWKALALQTFDIGIYPYAMIAGSRYS
jgi:hypothetical protein